MRDELATVNAGLGSAADEPPRTEILRIAGAAKSFDGIQAIDDLTFSVAAGEFFTLLGPSGCGKTTTLMAIAGFEALDRGAIELRGTDISGLPPDKRDMGVVFQSYALFPHMTVFDNVAFPLKMRGLRGTEIAEKVRLSLSQVELDDRHEHAFPGELSGGQQQRVALARATVFDPAVLLMDEPLSALDRQLRQTLQFELRHLQQRLNTTVIYVTHDQEEALVLSDRIGVMRNGRFEQVGPPELVYEAPANDFVAGFLGDSNRVPVTVSAEAPGMVSIVPRGCSEPAFGLQCEWDAGDEGILMVRPEQVQVVAESAAVDGDAASCPGVVRDVAFLGSHVRVECEAFDRCVWTAYLGPREERSVALSDAQPGRKVRLEWSKDSMRLLRP